MKISNITVVYNREHTVADAMRSRLYGGESPKVALLHYWLTNMRGGEQVLSALGEIYHDADIVTHAFGPAIRVGSSQKGSWQGHRVRESVIAKLPFGRRFPQLYLPLMPKVNRALDLRGYDLIISSESGPIKGITKPEGAVHICYCHTPMRYVWDLYEDYYRRTNFFGRLAMMLLVPYMRREDLHSAASVDRFIANSNFVADRIKRIYGRDAVVVNPPVNIEFYSSGKYDKKGYYLFAGASVGYKRLDLAKAACRRLGRELRVVGGGVSDEDMRRAYAEAKALIFPGIEDFGIVPVEAQAAGTPVIAFGKGGALETVKDGVTGLFFKEQTVDSLCAAILEFERRDWSADACRENASRFTKNEFLRRMREVIARAVE